MKNLQVKVCGLTEEPAIESVAAAGADLAGLVFYPKSPRYVGKKPILRSGAIDLVGVFVNESVDEVKDIAAKWNLKYVQLHGQETPQYAEVLASLGLKVIRAFGISDDFDFNLTKEWAIASKFVFDTKVPNHGGSGKKFDWKLLDRYQGSTPFLLSGGISMEDLSEIRKISHSSFAGVDINSRFELFPGKKNTELIRLFIQKLKS